MKKLREKLNYLLLVPVAWAEEVKFNITPETGSEFEALGGLQVPAIVSGLIKILLIASALIAFVFLVIGGIRWITSGGDKEQTAKAQSTITAALIGLVIVFAAWAIIHLVQTFFGIKILEGLTITSITG